MDPPILVFANTGVSDRDYLVCGEGLGMEDSH